MHAHSGEDMCERASLDHDALSLGLWVRNTAVVVDSQNNITPSPVFLDLQMYSDNVLLYACVVQSVLHTRHKKQSLERARACLPVHDDHDKNTTAVPGGLISKKSSISGTGVLRSTAYFHRCISVVATHLFDSFPSDFVVHPDMTSSPSSSFNTAAAGPAAGW